MGDHVCPWWVGYLLISPVRRLVHDPEQIVGPYVRQGMTVMDVGCGMGFFTIAMAAMVGEHGQVIAVDLQERMLKVLQRRAACSGLADRILMHKCEPDRLGIDGPVDFILAFHMVHEVPNPRTLFSEFRSVLAPGGTVLYTEPKHHVTESEFNELLAAAEEAGLRPIRDVSVRWSLAKLLEPRF